MLKIKILTLIITLVLVACGRDASKSSQGDEQQPNNSNQQGQDNQQSGGITSAGDPTNPVIVSGQIVHQRGVKHTYDHDFNFTEESHVVVQLVHYLGQASQASIVKEIRFSHVKALPLAYAITEDSSTGSSQDLFAREGTYAVQTRVHSQAGDEVKVGDLITETSNIVSAPMRDMTVFVTGVEDCAAENAGGFCSTIK